MAERAASQRPNTELLRQQALAALPGDGRVLIQADGQVKIVTPRCWADCTSMIHAPLVMHHLRHG